MSKMVTSDLEEPKHWEKCEAPFLAVSAALSHQMSEGGPPPPRLRHAAALPVGSQPSQQPRCVWWDRILASETHHTCQRGCLMDEIRWFPHLQQDPWSSVASTDDELVFVQRTGHFHLVITAAEDTGHTLTEEDMHQKGTAQHLVISRNYLKEVSSLWGCSILTDMNQDPPDWIHVYSLNIWTLTPVLIGYVSMCFVSDWINQKKFNSFSAGYRSHFHLT